MAARNTASPPKSRPAAAPADLAALVAAWPGPAALLGVDGGVLAANDQAALLLGELAVRGEGSLAAIAKAVHDEGAARTDTVAVPAKPNAITFDVSVAPAGGGVLVLARDMSLAANLRHALADSRQRFKDLVGISSDFAWETDRDGAFTFVSPQGALGWSANDLLGRAAVSLLDDNDGRGAAPFRAKAEISQVELWLKRQDGELACVAVSALPLQGAEGAWRGARGVWRDITEIHASAAALADAESRERLVGYITRTIRDEVEPDAMLRTAASAIAHGLSASACRIWDVSRDGDLALAAEYGAPTIERVDANVAAHARRLAEGGDAPNPDRDDQLELATKTGRFLGAATRFHGQINGAIGLWRAADDADWTGFDRGVLSKIADQIGIAQEQVANHEALAKQARTDALTGLLNRRGFARQLDREILECKRHDRPGALVYVDLDNFKAVNDRLGHPAGDAALKGLADALRGSVRAGDLIARLGGDEFALWLSATDRDFAVERGKEILALKESIASYSAGPDKPLGLSVGIAIHRPAENESAAELLERADQAMYVVKKNGKGYYAVAPDIAEFRAARQAGHAGEARP